MGLAVKFAQSHSDTMNRAAEIANEDTQKFIEELKTANQ